MASPLKIIILPCLLSFLVLLGEVKPVLAKKGEGITEKVKLLEKSVSELKQKMKEQEEIMKEQNKELKEAIKEQEEIIKEQNETIKELKEEIKEQDARMIEQEEKIKILEECEACSKIQELNKTLNELEEKIPEPDIDECATNTDNCDVNAVCINTHGSYTCTCKAGFSGDGESCTDIDECATNSDSCDDNADCNNTPGLYTCTCKTGFSGDGQSCTDIDECVSGVNDCHSSASCTNTVGSYTCSCNPPFTGDGKNCTQLPTECQSYQSLTSADRKITYTNQNNLQCDSNLGPGWFRFQGAAGTRMPTSCPPSLRCSTHSTGWLNGEHPTVADGQVTRTVCFHYWSDCCESYLHIQVRNCGPFYVYYFNGSPGCNRRYCSTD